MVRTNNLPGLTVLVTLAQARETLGVSDRTLRRAIGTLGIVLEKASHDTASGKRVSAIVNDEQLCSLKVFLGLSVDDKNSTTTSTAVLSWRERALIAEARIEENERTIVAQQAHLDNIQSLLNVAQQAAILTSTRTLIEAGQVGASTVSQHHGWLAKIKRLLHFD